MTPVLVQCVTQVCFYVRVMKEEMEAKVIKVFLDCVVLLARWSVVLCSYGSILNFNCCL